MGSLFSASRVTARKVKETPPPGTKWHEFVWRHGGKSVYITGTFDGWSGKEHQMSMTPDGVYKECIPLDPNKQWQFKFVVDGVWRCSLDYPTIKDRTGNTNNVLYPE